MKILALTLRHPYFEDTQLLISYSSYNVIKISVKYPVRPHTTTNIIFFNLH